MTILNWEHSAIPFQPPDGMKKESLNGNKYKLGEESYKHVCVLVVDLIPEHIVQYKTNHSTIKKLQQNEKVIAFTLFP